jgi:MFS family permease
LCSCTVGRDPQFMRKAGRREGTYRAALAVPEFRVIFAAATVNITGSVVCAVALTVLVFERTRSPLLSALTFALGFVPYVFGGTLLSGIVDRVPPRRLLVCCFLGSAGLTAVMAIPRLPVPALLLLLVGTSTLTSVSSGAQGALVRSAVPEATYVPARSLLRIASQLAQVVGNAFGGLLLVVLTPSGAIAVDSVALVASALLLRFGLRSRPVAGVQDGTGLVRDSLRGLRLVFAQAGVRRLVLMGWLVPLFAVAPEALAAPYVVDKGGSPALVGWWLVALPTGMIVGDLLGVLRLSPQRQRRLVGLLAGASFVPYLAFAAKPAFGVAWILLAAAGVCGMYSLGLDGLVRQAVPEHLFARTMAVSSAGLMTLQGLGFALAGAAGQVAGPATAIFAAGICGIVSVVLLRPRAKDLQGRAPSQAVTPAAVSQ